MVSPTKMLEPRAFSGAVVSQKERQAHEAEGFQAPGGSSEARKTACVWSGVHAAPYVSGVH